MKYKSVVHARVEHKTFAEIAAIAKSRDVKIGSVVRELVEKALERLKVHARKKTKTS